MSDPDSWAQIRPVIAGVKSFMETVGPFMIWAVAWTANFLLTDHVGIEQVVAKHEWLMKNIRESYWFPMLITGDVLIWLFEITRLDCVASTFAFLNPLAECFEIHSVHICTLFRCASW